jgi:hypothetical protein
MIRPSTLPEWCTFPADPADKSAPNAAKKQSGFKRVAGIPEKPPFQDFNWYMSLVYDWVLYFSSMVQTGGAITVANNQVAPANFGTLLFAPASFRSFEVQIGYDAVYSAIERTSLIKLYAVYNNGGYWTWNQTEPAGEIASGITFSVLPSGQVQYVSDNKAAFTGAIASFHATGTPAT